MSTGAGIQPAAPAIRYSSSKDCSGSHTIRIGISVRCRIVRIVSVPAAGALNEERHLYEKLVLVVEGRGSTEVWQEGQSKRHAFEWQAGSLFTIPLNARHRLINAANSPALLLCRYGSCSRSCRWPC